MNNPEYVKIGKKKYKINTDFRIAIECNQIAQDDSIGDYEKILAIIYKLYGDEGLDDIENHQALIDLGQKYLLLGKTIEDSNNQEESDMDYVQDMDYIEVSFKSDYNIDLKDIKMHWWTFSNLINGLSDSELGNCCILNRVRNLRNMDVSKIKDDKERQKIMKAKEQVALKKTVKVFTKEEEEAMDEFNKLAGL